jgi:hypothetical protein
MMRSRRTSLLWVVTCVSVAGLVLAGAGFWFYVTHHESVPASAQLAAAEFARLRARFPDRRPLIDMSRREGAESPGGLESSAPLHSFHTVVFDTRGGERIVHMTAPYWFGRLFVDRSGQFRRLGKLTFLDDTEFDPEAIRLSLRQLERQGPGLIVYVRHESGGQFIAWVE